MWKERLLDYFNKNKGSSIGALVGLLIGIFVLWINFFRTLFLVICIFIGYYIGKKKDKNESFLDLIQKILPEEWK